MAYLELIRIVYSKGDLITYGELCGQLGLHHRSAAWFLGVIQYQMEDLEMPPLQALVVSKKFKVPGKGYLATGRSPSEHSKAVRSVLAYNWPSTAPF